MKFEIDKDNKIIRGMSKEFQNKFLKIKKEIEKENIKFEKRIEKDYGMSL